MTQEHPIIEHAKRHRKTVKDIASAAGCSRMTLYRIMRGEQNATLDLLKRIVAATDNEVTLAQLMEPEGAAA